MGEQDVRVSPWAWETERDDDTCVADAETRDWPLNYRRAEGGRESRTGWEGRRLCGKGESGEWWRRAPASFLPTHRHP